MLAVLLIHAANEYLLQPERFIVLKRESKPASPVFLLAHIAPPALACVPLGLTDLRGAIILMVFHALADGPLAKFVLRRLPGQTVLKAMESDYGQWPVQVHALHIALAAVSEQFSWLLFHALALLAACSIAGIQ